MAILQPNLLLSGSPLVTSLGYDYQSRTLTCTSTGGPATTVTWRRNGAVITLNATHQQTTRVVYPVNGTYQTVLIIGPSVSQSDIVGTYSCTVENARGRSLDLVVVSGNGEYSFRPRFSCSRFCLTALEKNFQNYTTKSGMKSLGSSLSFTICKIIVVVIIDTLLHCTCHIFYEMLLMKSSMIRSSG